MYRQPSSLVDRKQFGSSRSGVVSAEHPPSPPDTESLSSLYATPQRRPSHPDNYMLPTIPATPETWESARVRRLAGPSSQSFSRDFRGASRPQTRWLVVLMPPENLITELSVGYKSAGKLSSGLLVPLFPTLFAQLAAIAKEFSLPSTTGLCLYLHLPDAPESPRITDEVWPLLWARHLHTDDASLPLGLPVAGRVQFDIDIPSARWYPMWHAHVSRKELVPDLARAMPTSPKPLSSPLGDSNRTRGVQVPRPLALVPRQEPVLQVQIDSGPSPVPSPTPKSASNETVEKVRRWSALVTPEPAALQPEAPAIPTDDSAPLPTETTAVEDAEPEPLNFDDFQWSVTSAGPPSPASSCATTASSRVPSIHILERAEGSVALTPTTATSWGPQYDSDVESELELEPEWGVRSPDVGERAEGSVLLTPSTATSWGAPLSYPPTPAQWAAMHELVRSPDLGERAEGSVLLTPSTATTWGAPLSYPPTPAQWHALYDHIIHSPDLGRRAEGSVLLTPSTATSWGPPLSYPPTPAGARPREWVPSPGLGDREEMSPGRVGRMSTMQWGTEVETEEEAYARMGLPYRWEFGWPTASPLPLPGVQEEEEEVEAGSIRIELVRDDAPVARSVSAAVHGEVSVQSRAVYEEQEHYERDMPFSEQEDDAESLYDGAFGGDEEREELQGSAFEFELELESPHVVQITEERSLAFEDGHGQELADALGQEAEVSFSHEMDDSYREPFEYAPEDVDEASDYASEASEGHASEASIEAGVFEYSFPESAAQPSFPVSVSASDDAINFPDLDHIAQPESPMMLSRSVELPVHIEVTPAPVAAPTLAPVRSYGAYPYLVIYPSTYPHLDLYPSVPASRLQTRARPTVDTHAQIASVPAPVESVPTSSPVESVRSRSRSPPSSRKSSLSITVPMSRARSRSILAVNPADKRSARWSGPLPPVPPVPRAIREGSVGSISSLRSVREESVKSVREESVERVQEEDTEDTGVQPQSEQLRERRPSIVHDGAEFELSVPSKKPSPQALPTAYPYRYPDNLGQLYPSKEALSYPTNLARIYPAVRPAQAPLSGGTKTARLEKSLAVSSGARYPAFNLYPAVYPYNLESIYPSVSRPAVSPKASVVSASAPAPLAVARALAPSASVPATVPKSQHIAISRGYPFIELYPAVYPHNLENIYPSVTPKSFVPARAPAPVIAARSPIPSVPVPAPKPQHVAMSRGYPFIELYPAVYPYNLESIYPSVALKSHVAPSSVPAPLAVARVSTQSVPAPTPTSKPQHVMSRGYPFIELYPAVYPYNLERIYPSVSSKSFVAPARVPTPVIATRSSVPSVPVPASKPQYVAVSRGYPFIELYPAVYPHNLENIYPSVSSKSSVPLASVPVPAVATRSSISSDPAPVAKLQRVAMSRGYPFIDLYPAVYPYNLECLHPSVSKAVASPALAFKQAQLGTPASSNAAASSLGYPFNLYNLYPSVSSAPESAGVATQGRKGTSSAVKPHSPVKSLSVRLTPTYPNIELYAPIYPFNLVIYPSVVVLNKAQALRVGEDVADSSSDRAESLVEMPKVEANVFPARTRKTHARLHTETWRKTHSQLVAEALEEASPARKRTPKSHIELQTEVFPNGLPEADVSPASPEVMITPVETIEEVPEVEAALKPEVAPALEPTPAPTPAPAVAALRRQRSGTIMRPPPSGPLPTPSSTPQAVDLGRSRSLLERTKMFERAPARSQTGGPQGPPRTLVRQKSATFERAKSLFHTPEEDHAQSEGSRTPPRPTRRVSKLDMSKFGFA